MEKVVNVIGGGLAGAECSYQLAKRGIKVNLFECKPLIRSKAHEKDTLAEVVCSNSFKSMDNSTASGLLKEELTLLDSLLLKIAHSVKVPAGNALAVDRDDFSLKVTSELLSNNSITVIHKLVDALPNEPTIITTGPLTLEPLSSFLSSTLGFLHFYDAAAPIIAEDGIDYNYAFLQSRYDRGESDYINCLLTKDEYYAFVNELVKAERVEKKDFEKSEIFDSCMPIEVMAMSGKDTLRFGPLKPVGIVNPITGERPFAVVQLRKENTLGLAYNLVGFQTNLKFGEQKRVFSMIPALKNVEFLRFGVMHRNSFINAPKVINSFFQTQNNPALFIAGQLCGVEGYVESIASGLIAAINMAKYLNNDSLIELPKTTIIGALSRYIATQNSNFQPMNANFGILPPLDTIVKDKIERKKAYFNRGVSDLKEFLQNNNL